MVECKLEGCPRPSRTKSKEGWCLMHYRRVLKEGGPGEVGTRRNVISNGMKFCKFCNTLKSVSNFSVKSDGRTYYFCNECKPNIIKKKNISGKYGLTENQYLELIKDGCAICGSHHRIAIDHDHTCCPGSKSCGKCIRGALCMRHNVALGNVRDSIEELNKLLEYLKS